MNIEAVIVVSLFGLLFIGAVVAFRQYKQKLALLAKDLALDYKVQFDGKAHQGILVSKGRFTVRINIAQGSSDDDGPNRGGLMIVCRILLRQPMFLFAWPNDDLNRQGAKMLLSALGKSKPALGLFNNWDHSSGYFEFDRHFLAITSGRDLIGQLSELHPPMKRNPSIWMIGQFEHRGLRTVVSDGLETQLSVSSPAAEFDPRVVRSYLTQMFDVLEAGERIGAFTFRSAPTLPEFFQKS
jgi:hypothetical protein